MSPDPGPLRLVYQSFGQLGGMEAYQRRLEATVAAAAALAAPGATIALRRLESTVVAGKGFASAQALDLPAILRSLGAAEDDGAEAIAIGNGFDPGLWEARELLEVPVLGLFETAAMRALRVGWRVGVLTSGRSGVTRIEELVARYGIASRFVRPEAVGISVPQVVASLDDDRAMTDALGAADRAIGALAERGAEVVVVASGALDVLLDAASRPSFGVPVLPSVQVLVTELVAAATLARQGITAVSRVGRFAMPPTEIRAALRDEPRRATEP